MKPLGPTATSHEQWVRLAYVAVVVAMPVYLIAAVWVSLSAPWGGVGALGWMVAIIGLNHLRSVVRERSIVTLQRCGFTMCTQCRYVLRGLPDGSKCPECGSKYSFAELRSRWTRTYRLEARAKS